MLVRLALAVALLLAAASPALAQIGTAAAVNQDALGTPPGGAIRTITLGSNVVLDERIVTNDAGLVQILFLDGTTLMLGPRSDLVIDSFFYDPAAKEAKLAATMTKGALRFIGGLVSKSPDSARIATPIGIVGIRGAITDIVLDPPSGAPQYIAMHFGSEVTLSRGLELVSRLFEAGYSMVLGGDGTVGVQKTPPAWSSQIQQALAGPPGSSGGSPNQPTDQAVAESGIPEANSIRFSIDSANQPLPLTPEEVEELIAAVTTYDELRQFVVPKTFKGVTGGVGRTTYYDIYLNPQYELWQPVGSPGDPLAATTLSSISLDATGRPVAGVIELGLEFCTGCFISLTYEPDGSVSATVQVSPPYYLLNGVPALTGSLRGQSDVTLPAGVDYCQCAFLHWGFWDVEGENQILGAGAWAVADRFTSAGELDTLGVQELSGTEATYSGHAVGYAGDINGEAYLAAGDLDLTWSFANRVGDVDITGFDGRDFSGPIAGDVGVTSFSGSLTGDGTGDLRGLFVNSGNTPAAGVLGDFTMTDGNWNAAGIFAAERGPDIP